MWNWIDCPLDMLQECAKLKESGGSEILPV